MDNFLRILPTILFTVVTLALGFIVMQSSKAHRKLQYAKDYFIGGRELSGFVLAMTLVATYASVSSFVGGPGMAWKLGFSWVYYATIQIGASFLVLGVLGKKIALIGRKIDAITLVDVIRHRFESNFLAEIAAVIMLVFFSTTMIAQFVGGAKLFEAATGYSYQIGLLLFGLVVIIYTTVGGFKGVAITDTAAAIIMVIGTVLLAAGVLSKGGGFGNIMETISTQNPEMMDPTTQGVLPINHFISGWFLVGICLLGLPQSVVRGLSYKNTKSLHRAMIYGTVVMGIMMVGMHFIGVLARGVITDPTITDVDSIIPTLVVKSLSPFLAGICIVGPLAASMSTVSSLLIGASSNIMKDIVMHRVERKGQTMSMKNLSKYSMIITFVIGVIVFLLALKPPAFIVWINLFAFGGLESAFFFVLLLGLFWKRANRMGAYFGMISGVAVYVILSAMKVSLWNFHNIVWGIAASFIFFMIGSFLGKEPSKETLSVYFPQD